MLGVTEPCACFDDPSLSKMCYICEHEQFGYFVFYAGVIYDVHQKFHKGLNGKGGLITEFNVSTFLGVCVLYTNCRRFEWILSRVLIFG